MSELADPLRLPDYQPGTAVELDDADRWPDIDPAARSALQHLRVHPDAPPWTHRAGHRLDAAGIARARRPLPVDGWLTRHLATARELPAYRGWPGPLERLEDFPVIGREQLLADIGGFVPRGAPLAQMVQGSSSGSSGHALSIPDDLEDVARTFWTVVDLLAAHGTRWTPDGGRLGLVNLVAQRQAYTYAGLLPVPGAATMARINLTDPGWPAVRRDAFLRAQRPQLLSGSPASLAVLLESGVAADLDPVAVVSGATHLSRALRADLESTLRCPVLDLYGLHETRPIAAAFDDGPLLVLDRPVLVEVMDADGRLVPDGQRGELVVTAGSNPLLPLVRYRTGDAGRLVQRSGRVAIADLEGRADVTFVAVEGRRVPSVDLTQQLQDAGVRAWSVEQDIDGSVRARVVGGDPDRVAERLTGLLGHTPAVDVLDRVGDLGPGKPRRYRSALDRP